MRNPKEASTPKKRREATRCIKCRRYALTLTRDLVDPLCKKHYGDKLVEAKKNEVKESGGKRGVYIPESIIEQYENSIIDPELVELREDIATCEARARQLLKQIKESPHENLSFISLLKTNLEQNLASLKRGGTTYPELVNNLQVLMDEKVSEKILWDEFYKVTELKRKLVSAESKRLHELGWTPERVFAIVAATCDMIRPLLSDDKLRLFFNSMSDHPLFNNQQFKFLPQADLSQLALPDRLNAEMDLQAIEVQKQKDGTYAAEENDEK